MEVGDGVVALRDHGAGADGDGAAAIGAIGGSAVMVRVVGIVIRARGGHVAFLVD
eukprot:CAMPEP_0113323538 /NCGR_PEP_ID=MMETSP0010_2-20120614/16384_1 /TAXON_ID=216773 ORGANISM="Corethron hystrix, Strain 308" /NCGR_SAMPLE_ID=MMETSP0010_2 /ASSEMBLY_ACC=CAM_ASM_000155 /LENGTH=54 /DNA_ID=CAMNT_0000182495 /DNA_START=9 /DNA_END=173 /DNA_ORIENTATION=+ /assembly_acc=CAM_ASM_000155